MLHAAATLAVCITGAFRASNLTFQNFEWAIPEWKYASKFVVTGRPSDEEWARQLEPTALVHIDYERNLTSTSRDLTILVGDKSLQLVRQWEDWDTCWRAITVHEDLTGTRHALYMRLRPDVVFLKPLPLEAAARVPPQSILLPEFDGWTGVNDRVALGDRAAMTAYFTLVRNYTATARRTLRFFRSRFKRVVQGAAETTLKRHLLDAGVRLVRSRALQVCRVTADEGGALAVRGIDWHWHPAMCQVRSVPGANGPRRVSAPSGGHQKRQAGGAAAQPRT